MHKKYNREFHNHKNGAKLRGIKFLLSFDEWLSVWKKSGKLSQRGRMREQYCMARFGDKGPYRIGNVKIIPNYENRAEMKLSNKTRLLMRKAKLGKKLSAAHRAKIAAGNTGKKMSVEALKNMRASKLGRKNPMFGHAFSKQHRERLRRARKRRGPFSIETREKIRQALLLSWKNKRDQHA